MPTPLSRPTPAYEAIKPVSQRFDGGLFASLVVHDDLKLREDQVTLQTQRDFGVRIARNSLSRRGVGRELPSDLSEAAQDVIQELSLKLRLAEKSASEAVPVRLFTLPQLLDRIEQLVCIDKGDSRLGATFEEPRADDEADQVPAGRHHNKAPGAHLLAAMKELSARLLETTPAVFGRQAHPWTSARISSVVGAAMHRLNGYTLTALSNLCSTFARRVGEAASESYDESHHAAADRARHRRSSVVMSPHMRTVVVMACDVGLAEVRQEEAADGKHTRNLPFVEAAIKVLPLLLDAPDERPWALAKAFVASGGKYSDQEVHRGLTAAFRHPIYQRVIKRIERGGEWSN